MAIKGLERAIENLNSINRIMVPQASAWALNRVAANGVSVATRRVAKETIAGDNRVTGIPLKLVKQRVRVSKASATGRSTAKIKVNRGNLPAIKLGAAQVRNTRRKGPLVRKNSVLRIGRYVFRDAFIQQLANGRWHVMKRIAGKSRYPIDVVKIPLAAPLTTAFETEKKRMLEEEMPKQLGYALKQQLRLHLTR
ncbi:MULTISPECIES: phage tail protein [Cedecea]|uniref:Phage tail protein n=1 Tax=Cedecea davisae TaxID=158484 RepID=A0ABS6DKB9_9ENTR|nr:MULTISPECIES: phage tail protein [Cedecea]MBU4683266.1 phage tail protein [Cedecea davisae]MBU4686730.1 phage tail protein [Cedecea davisae]